VKVVRERYSPDFRLAGTVVTVGFFDGVHRGHASLIARARGEARSRSLSLVVVSFEVHPMAIIAPERVPPLLSGRAAQLRELAGLGVDVVYYLRFDGERAKESPEAFVRETLIETLGAQAVVVGKNFTFGHRGLGTVDTLASLACSLGFDVIGLDLLAREVEPVSSSSIRKLIKEGELRRAGELLGRNFELDGVVVHGDQRGRALGFPTANVDPPAGRVIPGEGVYAGWAWVGSVRYGAALSVGTRPTFYRQQGATVIEAHLLNFEGDLYGKEVRLEFFDRVRGQLGFAGSEDLIAQMTRDLDAVSELLASLEEGVVTKRI